VSPTYSPEQLEALKREREGYLTYGKDDRAKAVAAELRAAGVDVDDEHARSSAPKGRRSRQTETAEGSES
jgi:hypothetical protein